MPAFATYQGGGSLVAPVQAQPINWNAIIAQTERIGARQDQKAQFQAQLAERQRVNDAQIANFAEQRMASEQARKAAAIKLDDYEDDRAHMLSVRRPLDDDMLKAERDRSVANAEDQQLKLEMSIRNNQLHKETFPARQAAEQARLEASKLASDTLALKAQQEVATIKRTSLNLAVGNAFKAAEVATFNTADDPMGRISAFNAARDTAAKKGYSTVPQVREDMVMMEKALEAEKMWMYDENGEPVERSALWLAKNRKTPTARAFFQGLKIGRTVKPLGPLDARGVSSSANATYGRTEDTDKAARAVRQLASDRTINAIAIERDRFERTKRIQELQMGMKQPDIAAKRLGPLFLQNDQEVYSLSDERFYRERVGVLLRDGIQRWSKEKHPTTDQKLMLHTAKRVLHRVAGDMVDTPGAKVRAFGRALVGPAGPMRAGVPKGLVTPLDDMYNKQTDQHVEAAYNEIMDIQEDFTGDARDINTGLARLSALFHEGERRGSSPAIADKLYAEYQKDTELAHESALEKFQAEQLEAAGNRVALQQTGDALPGSTPAIAETDMVLVTTSDGKTSKQVPRAEAVKRGLAFTELE